MMFRNASALVGGLIILGFVLVSIFGPLIAPFDPNMPSLRERLQSPSVEHPFGTDFLGRDILSRMLHGARYSLLAGASAGLLGLVVGTVIGVTAGWKGGVVDDMLMRAVDALLAFPSTLLAIGIVGALGVGFDRVIIAVGLISIGPFARVARAGTLKTKTLQYVDAARALGSNSLHILAKHIIPSIAMSLVVLFSLRTATAILTTSSLSFLGLGAQPPSPEWGAMLNESRNYLRTAPHMAIAPGLAITLVIIGLNLLGDGLRQIVDPKLGERS